MSKEVFEQLLAEFREAWCRHGDKPFNVEIFAPSRIVLGGDPLLEEPPYDRKKYDLITEVALPADVSREVTPDQMNSTLWGWAVAAKDDGTAEARKVFARLCDEAGAALPPEFRGRLAGLCPWNMPRPATWWVALLVMLTGESAYWPDGRYRGTALLLRPFLLCVEAIEQCGLHTDSPRLPDLPAVGSDGSGPEGDDKVKKHERGNYTTDNDPKADAKLWEDWQAAKRQGVRTIAEFCSNRSLNESDTRAAFDRHAKRQHKRRKH